MTKPAKTPDWNASYTEEPSEQLRTDGWQDNEKPKASHFNWLFNNISQWFTHLKDAPAPDSTGKITIPNPTTINVDSESDGLLVNQTGSGAAIRVEDSGNPDATPFIVDSYGNVGIGTDSPTYKLHIESDISQALFVKTASAEDAVVFGVTGQTYNPQIAFSNNEATNTSTIKAINSIGEFNSLAFLVGDAEGLRISDSGCVGIGRLSGSARLEVQSVADQLNLWGQDYEKLRVSVDSSGVRFDAAKSGGALPITFQRGGTESLRITSSGVLMVGGASSARTLDGITSLVQVEAGGYSNLSLITNRSDANGSTLSLGKTRGTSVGSNTVIASGDSLGQIAFRGSDGFNLLVGAQISAQAEATPSTNSLSGRIVFSTANAGVSSEKVRISAVGNMGIGTSVPAAKIHVSGDAIVSANTTTDALRITQTGTGAALRVEDSTNPDVTPFIVDTNGNVGIGTESPTSLLEVVGTSAGSQLVVQRLRNAGTTVSTQTTLSLMANTNTGTAITLGAVSAIATNTTGSGDLILNYSRNASLQEGLRINSVSGNVGIGTSSPADKLDLSGGLRLSDTSGNQTIYQSSTAGRVLLSANNTNGVGNAAGVVLRGSTHATNPGMIEMWTSSAGRLFVDTNGNVGVGTASPAEKLSVVGVIQSTSGGFKFPDGTIQTSAITNVITANSTTPALRITQTGTGDALVVEDSANPDATPFRIDQFGHLNTYGNITTSASVQANTVSTTVIGTSAINDVYSIATPGLSIFDNDNNGAQLLGINYLSAGIYVPTSIQTSSTGDALRVTQTGTGAALRVEDSANPDATPFIVDTNGNVGIGTATPAQKLSVTGVIESTTGGIKFPDGTTQTSAVQRSVKVITTTAPFSITANDDVIVNASGTRIEVDLNEVTIPTGKQLTFKNISGRMYIYVMGTDGLIDGANSLDIDLPEESVTLVKAHYYQWYII